ncbi:MAG: hypothetical protein ACOYLO_14645 [Ferruginibacter sp.]
MSQVHLHLLITHLPIFGALLGAFVLGYGIWSKSDHTKIAAYFLFIISAIGTGIAYLTGEGAEEAVENLPGVAESIIGQHEEFAMYALVSLIVLGISSLMAIYVTIKKSSLAKTASVLTLFISLISFALIARTGYLGGQIRHTETTTGVVMPNGGGENEQGED